MCEGTVTVSQAPQVPTPQPACRTEWCFLPLTPLNAQPMSIPYIVGVVHAPRSWSRHHAGKRLNTESEYRNPGNTRRGHTSQLHLAMRLQLLALSAATVHAKLGRFARVVGQDVALLHSYDFIIVGGGTGGLTLADRLTEDPSVSVLVIEYGPWDQQENEVLIPGLTNASGSLPYWFPDLMTVPQPGLNNNTFNLSVACVIGGASTVNGMVFDRGGGPDYDSWEQLGNPGWDWDGLLPYFKKSENFTPADLGFAAEWNISWDFSVHASGGPIQASYPQYQFPATVGFLEGFSELGIPTPKDPNAGTKYGVFWVPSSIDPKTRTRSYARSAHYDRIIPTRPNYHVLPMHAVKKLLTEDQQVIGVEYVSRETESITIVRGNKEVIIAAGAIHSPQILQLSGIGPKYLLENLGVNTVVDLSGVGYNLQDHPYGITLWNFSNPLRPTYIDRYTNETLASENLAEYFSFRTGPYTVGGGNTLAFLPLPLITTPNITAAILSLAENTTPQDVYPFQNTPPSVLAGWAAQHAAVLPLYTSQSTGVTEIGFNTGPAIPVVLVKPLSRGFVAAAKQINNTSPLPAPPIIDYGAFLAPSDLQVVIEGVRLVRDLVQMEAARAAFGADTVEVLPAPGSDGTESDEELAALLRAQAQAQNNHPVGTCAMMPRELGGVVGPDLRVYGMEGLSVVDASVMPLVPAAHTAATVYAVAEKAADIIKKRHGITVGVLGTS